MCQFSSIFETLFPIVEDIGAALTVELDGIMVLIGVRNKRGDREWGGLP